jgi:hypothetical protein
LILALVVAISLFGLSARPTPVVSFLVGCLVLYAASRIYAFRLYSPERYYSVGVRAGAIALAASAVGFVVPRLRYSLRQPLRNAVAALSLAFFWLVLGNGVKDSRFGVALPYREDAQLYRFIRSLPPSTRVASHVMDGDAIPLFSARANNGSFETLQPWLTRSWKRQKARTEDTLRAFYATEREQVLAYADKYRVSHLLVNRRRYGGDFAKRARSFEPFSTFTKTLLGERTREQLILAEPPDTAVVFRHRQWALVSVAELRRAWGGGGR